MSNATALEGLRDAVGALMHELEVSFTLCALATAPCVQTCRAPRGAAPQRCVGSQGYCDVR